MRGFDTREVVERLRAQGGYEIVHESPGLELGVYVLVAPEPDRQQPHEDDEVYAVLEGPGTLEVEGERVDLSEGQAVFVPAGARPPIRRLRAARGARRLRAPEVLIRAFPGQIYGEVPTGYAAGPDSAASDKPDDADMPRTAPSGGTTMKIYVLALAIAATLCAVALGAGQALATTAHHATPRTLKVAMHDPGCHWFMRHGEFTKAATVKGRIRLLNLDEATLKVASRHALRHIPVGKSLVVGRGNYVIMMVGQAPDDNYLKLTVR